MSDPPRRVGIVGAGLVGLAVGRQLARLGNDVTVLEKEDDVARHQSGHNSGVVHSGLYYPAGSLKATLCRRGVHLLREFCAEHDLAYREIGKVVVALDDVETGTAARHPGPRAPQRRSGRALARCGRTA